MSETSHLGNISIVLNRPRYPENIGAAARAMCNMGLGNLVLVCPENFDRPRTLTLATHAAAGVIHEVQVFNDLQSALAVFGYVAGTTARLGSRRRVIVSPEKMAAQIMPVCQNNRAAVIFGPEDRGLTNEELRLCHGLVNIPTAGFSSLNLAHSVMVVCYELFKASLAPAKNFSPRLATRHELDAMYDQLKDSLVRINFIQPDNPDHWMDRFRRFFSRLPLRAAEVTIIRGICRQINWYAAKCYKDGKSGRKPDPALGLDPDDQ
ncbi:MAG: RNA methyltransferase [Desulfobacterales bacterium]|nr:RNA methyltransferase [Desulfobacterales bacterium]MBS3755448.1 RNA methyltransferase [Desulfobacterales bacterium]